MAGLGDAADELEAIAKHLRWIGDTELLRELNQRMRDAVTPVEGEIRAGLGEHLSIPRRYGATLAGDLRIGISVRSDARNPGVEVNGSAIVHARKLRYLDAGRLTHPLFGERVGKGKWYTQEEPSVTPGWFTGPCEAAAPRVHAGIERGLEDIAAKATRRGP